MKDPSFAVQVVFGSAQSHKASVRQLTMARYLSCFISRALVILSGCRTASGKSIPGDGIPGLTQAFLSSGASSVIGSLWTVDDAADDVIMDSSAEIMTNFIS